MFDANTSMIRFYEKEFEILQLKNAKGKFRLEDLDNLKNYFSRQKTKALRFKVLKII
jgi:hypothetical protein